MPRIIWRWPSGLAVAFARIAWKREAPPQKLAVCLDEIFVGALMKNTAQIHIAKYIRALILAK